MKPFLAALAALTLSAGVAHADPVDDYTRANAPAICMALDTNPTVAGVEQVGIGMMNDGLTGQQAGQVSVRSVLGWCPQHLPELQAFIDKWTPAKPVYPQ